MQLAALSPLHAVLQPPADEGAWAVLVVLASVCVIHQLQGKAQACCVKALLGTPGHLQGVALVWQTSDYHQQ